MKFKEDQIEMLSEPLYKEAVKTRDGTGNTQLSYLPSYHVIGEANRIFGFGNWGHEVVTLKECDRTNYEKEPYNAGDKMKPMVSISYLCTLRLTVRGEDGENVFEDTGFGNGVAGDTAYGKGSCIELASKEAVTDALKRCLRYYGDKFGLSLYNKDAQGFVEIGDFEATKMVTEPQLAELRSLYEARGIDDNWVMAALQGEHFTGKALEDMRQDWFNLAISITSKYKLDEVNAVTYKADIENLHKLMKESATINMLKKLFAEAWRKTTEQKDKENQKATKEIYDEIKLKFEPKEDVK